MRIALSARAATARAGSRRRILFSSCSRRNELAGFGCRHKNALVEERTDEIAHVRAIEPEDPAGAATTAVEAERRDAADNEAGAQEVRTSRITEAGSAARGIVRQKQREVAGEAGVDLHEVRIREHADPLGLELHGIDALHAVSDRGEPGARP